MTFRNAARAFLPAALLALTWTTGAIPAPTTLTDGSYFETKTKYCTETVTCLHDNFTQIANTKVLRNVRISCHLETDPASSITRIQVGTLIGAQQNLTAPNHVTELLNLGDQKYQFSGDILIPIMTANTRPGIQVKLVSSTPGSSPNSILNCTVTGTLASRVS